ncbi:hypothetical protein GCM10009557_06900 [Virgisporangium ochraceum]
MPFRGVRLWLLAFAAFFLMIGGWALAAPYDGSADEHDHIYRAVGIWNGDLAPEPANAVRGSGAFVRVPRGLVVPDEPCWQFKPGMPASCAPEPTSDATTVRVGTGAGRYHPGYYAVVGVPLKLFPGWCGVLLARLRTGDGAATMLAASVVTIVTYFRRRLMLAGLLVAVTPMALHFFGAVNPNGLEIAAGVGLFTALIPLLLGRLDTVPRGLLVLAGTSAVLLASLRPTGLVYLFFGAVALFVPFRREILLRLWASTAARLWIGGVVLAGLVNVGYTLAFKGTDMGSAFRQPVTFERGQALVYVMHYWGEWAKQLVGVFSWLDIYLPGSMYVVWHMAAGALLVFGAAFGHWTDRWRLAVLVFGATGIPTFLQWWFLNETGFVTQGRYMLPGLVGVMIFAAWVLEERGLPERAGRSLTRLLLVTVVPFHVFSMLWAMVRWRSGLPDYGKIGLVSLWPLSRGWHPVVGSALPTLMLVVGLAGLAWLVWRLSVPVVTAVATTGPAVDLPEQDGRDDSDRDDAELATRRP